MTLYEIIRDAIETGGLTEMVENALTMAVEDSCRRISLKALLEDEIASQVAQKSSEIEDMILESISEFVSSAIEEQLDSTPF